MVPGNKHAVQIPCMAGIWGVTVCMQLLQKSYIVMQMKTLPISKATYEIQSTNNQETTAYIKVKFFDNLRLRPNIYRQSPIFSSVTKTIFS